MITASIVKKILKKHKIKIPKTNWEKVLEGLPESVKNEIQVATQEYNDKKDEFKREFPAGQAVLCEGEAFTVRAQCPKNPKKVILKNATGGVCIVWYKELTKQ